MHRDGALRGRSVAQLAVVIVAPRPHRAIGRQCKAVLRAARHLSENSIAPAGHRALTQGGVKRLDLECHGTIDRNRPARDNRPVGLGGIGAVGRVI